MADFWCACWMWPRPATAPDAAVFASLADEVTNGDVGALRNAWRRRCSTRRQTSRVNARFFHWTLEFPEAYFDAAGRPLAKPGLRRRAWQSAVGHAARRAAPRSARSSEPRGSLPASVGAANQSVSDLRRTRADADEARRTHRSGPAIRLRDRSHGCRQLRRTLLGHSSVDTITGFDNRKAIFPIHRSVRFMICIATGGAHRRAASRVASASTIRRCSKPFRTPAIERRGPSHPITLTPALLAALAGDKLAIPELRSEIDLRILETHRPPRSAARRQRWLGRPVRPRAERHRRPRRTSTRARSGCLSSKANTSSRFACTRSTRRLSDPRTDGRRPARCQRRRS